MRIFREDVIAITVDYQERLMPVIRKSEEFIERSQILLKGLEILEIPNIVTRQYPKGLGDTIEEIKQYTKNAPVYDKIEFSCYDNPEIKQAVDSYNVKNIILLGAEAHVCILQTLIDLIEAGYNVILVEDCISSRRKSDKKIALRRAENLGATITTSEAILFELTRKAGSPEFKEISKIVK